MIHYWFQGRSWLWYARSTRSWKKSKRSSGEWVDINEVEFVNSELFRSCCDNRGPTSNTITNQAYDLRCRSLMRCIVYVGTFPTQLRQWLYDFARYSRYSDPSSCSQVCLRQLHLDTHFRNCLRPWEHLAYTKQQPSPKQFFIQKGNIEGKKRERKRLRETRLGICRAIP